MIEIFYSSYEKQLNQAIFDHYLHSMPDEIQKKILKYRRWEDAHASLFGKLLLREKLNELGVDCSLENLKYTSYGKPFLAGSSFDFNISHSGKYVVCAFSTCYEVGIDLEEVKPIAISDFKNQFTDREWHEINGSRNILMAFYSLWTAKEATIKAQGKGLSTPLKAISIKENKAVHEEETWYLKEIDLFENYLLKVAYKEELLHTISLKLVHF